MKKLLILAALGAAAALPATASADRVHNAVSIHADQYHCCTDQIFGSVESGKPKCERNRTIKLFYEPFNGTKRDNKRGDGFQHVNTTTTDLKGEYFFEGVPQKAKVLSSDFPPGNYFARVTRATRSGDVCIRDDSRVIELNDFIVCEFKQSAGEDAVAQRKGFPC